jgi:uncharacterized protein YdeI (YjbR/CyaY-like superfamily)
LAKLDHLEKVEVTSIAALRAWLLANHAQKDSVWLVSYKKAAAEFYVSYSDIVDELLCFGWIDSLPRKLDARRTMTLLSPRKAKSGWSGVNKRKIMRLESEGQMHSAGLSAIARAKADGSWDLLNDVDALTEPEDLKAALAASINSRKNWDALAPSMRRGLLEQIIRAKKPDTRTARIAKIVEMAQGERK